MEPVRSLAGATPDPCLWASPRSAMVQEAVFSLCADCPVSTRKVLAPSLPPPIRLADAAKAQPLTTPQQPKEERITRAVHFCFASSKLTPEAHGALVAMRPLLQDGQVHHPDRAHRPGRCAQLQQQAGIQARRRRSGMHCWRSAFPRTGFTRSRPSAVWRIHLGSIRPRAGRTWRSWS
jgi:hypothetical protein